MAWLFRDTPIPDRFEHLRQKLMQASQTYVTGALDAARIGATVCMATCITKES